MSKTIFFFPWLSEINEFSNQDSLVNGVVEDMCECGDGESRAKIIKQRIELNM